MYGECYCADVCVDVYVSNSYYNDLKVNVLSKWLYGNHNSFSRSMESEYEVFHMKHL